MNATDVMTETAAKPRSTHTEFDAVWQRAKKRDLQRLPIVLALGAAFMFVIFLADTTTWPPKIDTGRWVLAAIMAGVFYVFLLGFSIRQKTSLAERYVSPLLGLTPEERRSARADLSSTHPASDPLLCEVETARARQLAIYGPSSLGAALAPIAVQAVASVAMFAIGSGVLGGLFALSALVNGWSAWKNYCNTQNARRFLDALGLEHD